jgi:hypothetical protein
MKALFVTLVAFVACVAFAPLSALGDTWGQPINDTTRFVVLSSYNNQAVLDKETGLVWEKSPSPTAQAWSNAQIFCTGAGVGNRKGWRLPTVQELASLQDPTVPPPGPTLPPGHPFTNVQSNRYWSATTADSGSSFAWEVGFGAGDIGTSLKSDAIGFWCVRGGQGVDPQ